MYCTQFGCLVSYNVVICENVILKNFDFDSFSTDLALYLTTEAEFLLGSNTHSADQIYNDDVSLLFYL